MQRIVLEACERYLIAMEQILPSGQALSQFELMTIEGANIRNVAFDVFLLADVAAEPALAA